LGTNYQFPIFSLEWTTPYFSASSRTEVTFGTFDKDYQYLNMDEEIDPKIDLVVIEYTGEKIQLTHREIY
jgi:hypothetical protein